MTWWRFAMGLLILETASTWNLGPQKSTPSILGIIVFNWTHYRKTINCFQYHKQEKSSKTLIGLLVYHSTFGLVVMWNGVVNTNFFRNNLCLMQSLNDILDSLVFIWTHSGNVFIWFQYNWEGMCYNSLGGIIVSSTDYWYAGDLQQIWKYNKWLIILILV